jgi:anti-sigma28 factor (negative regulator of flagellin synthesis)
MSDMSRVGESAEAMAASTVAAAESTHPAATPGLTATHALAGMPTDSGIEAIADDEEKVSAAGMLISQASTGSDVRFEKVAELRRAIETRNYSVPAENVAQKLMNGMLEP